MQLQSKAVVEVDSGARCEAQKRSAEAAATITVD